MAEKRLEYQQFVKGAVPRTGYGFTAQAPALLSYGVEWMKLPIRETHEVGKDIYELTAADFDRWCMAKSSTFSERSHHLRRFMQFMILDGGPESEVEFENAKEMDRFRVAMANAVVPERMKNAYGHDAILTAQRFWDIAQEQTANLEAGEVTIAWDDRTSKPEIKDEDTAYLVMRIWRHCWNHMKRLRGRESEADEGINIAIEGCNSRIEVCRDVFVNWLSRVLPAPVMSMIHITIGALANKPDWKDTACRILLDPENLNESRLHQCFVLKDVIDGVPGRVLAPSGWKEELFDWEKKLIEYLMSGEWPEYYRIFAETLPEATLKDADPNIVGRYNVALLADYDLLCSCLFIQLLLESGERNGYTGASAHLYNAEVKLAWHYRLSNEDIHRLMAKPERNLIARAENYAGNLDFDEYYDLLQIYGDLTYMKDADSEFTDRILNILSKQYIAVNDKGETVVLTNDEGVRTLPVLLARLKALEVSDSESNIGSEQKTGF